MLPRVIIHNAVSLDGRIDHFKADVGLYYELAMNWGEDATLVGTDTLLEAEDEIPAEEECHGKPPRKVPGDARPILVVPDSRGRIGCWHYWQRQLYWRDVVVLCSESTSAEYIDYLEMRNIQCVIAGEDRVDMRSALGVLKLHYGVETVRVDSGGTLNGILLRQGLVDEVSLLIHPNLVGGLSPRSFFRAKDLSSPEGVLPLKLVHFEKLRNDILWLRYEVIK